MIHRSSITFCFLLVSLLSLNSFGQLMTSESPRLDAYVAAWSEEYLEASQNDKLAIAVISEGYVYEYFLPDESTADTISGLTDSAVFEIGGLSKVFTAYLAAALIKEGILSPEDRLEQFFPEINDQLSPEVAAISLREMIVHTSGLQRQMGGIVDLDDPYSQYNEELLLEQISTTQISKKKKFLYSHFAYGILSHIIERASGLSYEELLIRYLSKPLQLNHLYTDNSPAHLRLEGKRLNQKAAKNWTFPVMVGTEGLESSLHDLALFTQAFLVAKEESAFAFCLESQEQTEKRGLHMAWGWHVFQKGKRQAPIYTHSGRTGGFSSYVAFVPDTNTAVILLSNSRNSLDMMGIELLEFINR